LWNFIKVESIFLVRFVLVTELETICVKHPFSFLVHFAIFETCTLMEDPIGQFWVFLVPFWHIACNAGRAAGGVLVVVFLDEGTTVNSPKQLTMTMFSKIVLQLLELQIPVFHVHLVPGTEIKTNFVEPRFSFLIHLAIFEDFTLP
jgi:hypothetical protein